MSITSKRLRIIADYIKASFSENPLYDPFDDLQEMLDESKPDLLMYNGMPLTEDVVAEFAEYMEEEDTKLDQITRVYADKVSGTVTGVCKLIQDGKRKFWIPILLSDNEYVATMGSQNDNLPLASFIKLTDGQMVMTINNKMREFALDPKRWSIANAVLGHEVGHYLANHLENSPGPNMLHNVDTNNLYLENGNINFYEIANALLHGGYFPAELEADRYGMALNGVGVLVELLYHSNHSGTLGIRTEFQNRLRHHILNLDTPGYIPTIPESFLDWYILTDSELEDITKDKVTAIKTVVKNKRRREK